MGSEMTNLILRNIGLLILTALWLFSDKFTDAFSHQKIANYTCQNGEIIDFLNVCDGNLNCEDDSDENLCESEAILYYYTYDFKKPSKTYPEFYDEHFVPKECLQFGPESDMYIRNDCDSYQAHKKLTLAGIYLNSKREFSMSLQNLTMFDRLRENKTPGKYFPGALNFVNIEIVPSSGPRVNIFYNIASKYLMIKTRNDTTISVERLESFSFTNGIKSPVFDRTTSKVYYIHVDAHFYGNESESRIKVCEENSLEICNDLVNDENQKPVLLAIAPEQKVLFCIQKMMDAKFRLYTYQLANNSESLSISQDFKTSLNSPRWLTTDSAQERLYWMDFFNNKISIYSIGFDGKNFQKVEIGQTIPLETSSFAVFNNYLYWPDEKMKTIYKCHVNFCDRATVFKRYETGNEFQLRYLFIDHRPPSRV